MKDIYKKLDEIDKRYLHKLDIYDLIELNHNDMYDFINRININGYNSSVDGTIIDIRSSGNFNYKAAFSKVNIVSDSDNDIYLGTGIGLILIKGLDENYEEVEEIIVMNGTTSVQSVYTYSRIYDGLCYNAGNDNGYCAGNITCSGDNNNFFTIKAGEPFYLGIGSYTVPANKSFILKSLRIKCEKNSEIDIYQMLAAYNLPPQSKLKITSSDDSAIFELTALIPEKTDLWFRAIRTGGTGNKKVSVGFSGYLIDDSKLYKINY